MAHRIYLYNVNSAKKRETPDPHEDNPLAAVLPAIGANDNDALLMMEWGYEFPLFLHPLFAGDAYLAPPLYNGTTGGIYANAFLGKAALVLFYSFIDRHANVLTDDPEAFRDGLGTTVDINKAIELYEQSAAKNVSYAHYNLGVLYYEGKHVEKNDEKALLHFLTASRL
jgi:hypothetical protein